MRLVIQRRLLILIGVQHTSLLVPLDLVADFKKNCVFLSFDQFAGTGTIVCPSILFQLGIRRMLCPCFHQMCLFQAPVHHCFICLLKHIATILQHQNVYSLEFVSTISRRSLSVHFWEGNELITMLVARCGRDVAAVETKVLLSSQLLSAIST